MPGPVPDLFFVSGSWNRPHLLRRKPLLHITSIQLTMHHGPHNANHHHHHHHGSPVPEELYLAFHARILETEVISECAAVERQYIDARTAHAQQTTVVQEDADGCTGTVHIGGGGRDGD